MALVREPKRNVAGQTAGGRAEERRKAFARLNIDTEIKQVVVPQAHWNNKEKKLVKQVNEEVKEKGFLKREKGTTKLKRIKPRNRKYSFYTVARCESVEPPPQRMRGVRRIYGSNFNWDIPDRMDEEWESLLASEGSEEEAFEKYLASMKPGKIKLPSGWKVV